MNEAFDLDRAVDALFQGELLEGDVLLEQARDLLAAVNVMPSEDARAVARANMFKAVAGRPSRVRKRMRLLAFVPAAAVLAFSGVAFAARNALPGDALYSIRRFEQASRLAVTVGAQSKAEALLRRAEGDLAAAKFRAAHGERHDALEGLAVFWRDLASARSTIDALEDSSYESMAARAGALESEGAALESSLADREAASDRGGDPSTLDDRHESGDDSGSGSSVSGGDDGTSSESSSSGESESGSGSGSSGEGSSSSGSGDVKDGSSGDDHSGPGGGEQTPSPSPTTHD